MQTSPIFSLFTLTAPKQTVEVSLGQARPVELSQVELDKVGGGLAPNSTWAPEQTSAPNSTW